VEQIREVTSDKLRGGYYTARPLVEFCVRRVRSLMPGDEAPTRWLEPSAGDGAFLRGLAEARDRREIPAPHAVAIEKNAREANKCALARRCRLSADVATSCSSRGLPATRGSTQSSEAVRALPVRRRAAARSCSSSKYCSSASSCAVSNLWIPFAILSLARLRAGGVRARVASGSSDDLRPEFSVRSIREFASLQIDLFRATLFPSCCRTSSC
jgi:hypothetical protein